MNYSTAKILLKNLSMRESKFVAYLKQKSDQASESDSNLPKMSEYCSVAPVTDKTVQIEIVSRVAWDFFEESSTSI
jgi:hypothetical protein